MPRTGTPDDDQLLGFGRHRRRLDAEWVTSRMSTDGSVGKIKLEAPATGTTALLNSVSSTDFNVVSDISVDKLGHGDGGHMPPRSCAGSRRGVPGQADRMRPTELSARRTVS